MKYFRIGIALVSAFFLCNSFAQQKKNVLLICVDDLRPELKSFGVDYIVSPNIDALAKKGRAFYSHYVNAPSCGPSRYTMLTGTYGTPSNDAIFKRANKLKKGEKVNLSMPEWFKKNGYTTISLGKVSHHPGGLGGSDWNDPNVIEMPNAWDKSLIPVKEWQHPRGVMHGLANGEIREKANEMDVFQTVEGEDTLYPDGHITNVALSQLEDLKKENKPFFFAVGFIKPHLPFGAPKKYYDIYHGVEIPEAPFPTKPNWNSTWHGSNEFLKYNRLHKDPRKDENFAKEVKKHYAACVSYADTQVGKVVAKLKETGLDKNTIIVLWGDHGWSLGDHGIWGKHSLFEEALQSPLIIVDKSIKKKGKGTNAIVETVDIFPTLCDLTDLPIPNFADGVSLKPLLKNRKEKGHIAYSYKGGSKTIRTDRYRYTVSKKGEELYDHHKDPYETKNIATKHPELIKQLSVLIKEKELKHKS
ncbi:iduronate 2-sulfatase [Wenyingzhuangia heitensis]|uniref:Iduronate 2-sulfatase n=1 Tax=Wenyingzhuangia heitensis TaxID=1487859 RepID=A0ABX0UBP3_9FLAO|nr:sulfatase [Wenyingzhuangia heitensis]NIJ46243.1 iduronate 2-sulfatase [Wenyingzhuangia heitensis]